MSYSMISQEMAYYRRSNISLNQSPPSPQKGFKSEFWKALLKPWAWLFCTESINEVDGILKYAMETQYLKVILKPPNTKDLG